MTITASRNSAEPAGAWRSMLTSRQDRPSWRDSAACREVDPDLFFPIGSTGLALTEIQQAKAICAACPVRQACLDYALAKNQQYGVWGGYDEEERRPLHRQYRERREAAARQRAAR